MIPDPTSPRGDAPILASDPSSLKPEVDMLREEVGALRLQLAKSEGPWYTKPATWISILALAVSTTMSVISTVRAHDEDVRANRRDVRSIIQRLTKLPIEGFELMEKNKHNPNGQALSSMLNQENVLLSNQAAEAIERYPKSFNSTEYFAVAAALANSNIFGKVPAMYQRAIDSASSATDYVAASRGFGGYLYNQGAHSEARKQFQNASEVWKHFPERNPTTVNFFDFQTYLYWAQAAYGAGQPGEAREYARKADETLARLPPGPFTDQLRGQLEATTSIIGR